MLSKSLDARDRNALGPCAGKRACSVWAGKTKAKRRLATARMNKCKPGESTLDNSSLDMLSGALVHSMTRALTKSGHERWRLTAGEGKHMRRATLIGNMSNGSQGYCLHVSNTPVIWRNGQAFPALAGLVRE